LNHYEFSFSQCGNVSTHAVSMSTQQRSVLSAGSQHGKLEAGVSALTVFDTCFRFSRYPQVSGIFPE